MTKLTAAIARIFDTAGQAAAGFVVTDDGLIVTCAHVVDLRADFYSHLLHYAVLAEWLKEGQINTLAMGSLETLKVRVNVHGNDQTGA